MSQPIAWSIAGSDSGGGAGIQADHHTFHAFGVHGCSVITTLTAQNSVTVRELFYVPAPTIHSQLSALDADLPAKAIKLGLLGNTASMHTVRQFLDNFNGTVVCDPVMLSGSGAQLLPAEDLNFYIKTIFPKADVLTPNIIEAEKITQRSITTPTDVENAAQHLLTLGPKSVLIKGGHSPYDHCSDYWSDGKTSFWLQSPRLKNNNTHGSGCTLSSAITSLCALGFELKDALVISKMYINQSIRHAIPIGRGAGPVVHQHWPDNPMDVPIMTPLFPKEPPRFPDCGDRPLGLYPVVDSADWISKLLPLGVSTIQLRIKNKSGHELEDEIKRSVALSRHYQARLFINDHWQLAIKHGAYGVHLGQGDLTGADINKIYQAGLRLGLSTHCYYEVARAHALKPSYIAVGPIFPTTSKRMPFAPQGISRLKRWRRTLNYPLVAIGGIGLSELPSVLDSGVDGVAMISAITQAADPIKATRQLLSLLPPPRRLPRRIFNHNTQGN